MSVMVDASTFSLGQPGEETVTIAKYQWTVAFVVSSKAASSSPESPVLQWRRFGFEFG